MGPTTRIRLGIGEYTEKIINGLIWVNWSWSFGTWFQNKPCPFESLAEPDILCHWVYIGYPCRSNGRPWAQIVWLWSLGVWFGVELNLETRITKSLVSLLDSNFVRTPESRVSFDWNLQSSPTYTPTFVPLMLFDFLVSEVVAVLSGKCFTTRCWWPHLHTKQLARCLISHNLLHVGYATIRCLRYGWKWFILSSATKHDTERKEKFVGATFRRMSHACSCHKHNMQWHDCLQIFRPKILWKLVANKLYVVVCKPNVMDDIICLW